MHTCPQPAEETLIAFAFDATIPCVDFERSREIAVVDYTGVWIWADGDLCVDSKVVAHDCH